MCIRDRYGAKQKVDNAPSNGNGEGNNEESENDENNESQDNPGGNESSNGTEVDTGNAQMTPDGGESTESNGQELSPQQQKQISNMFEKQKEFLDGQTPKSCLLYSELDSVLKRFGQHHGLYRSNLSRL